MLHRFFATLICLTFTLVASAQFINFGQSRASIRWKQINTREFQIIYPDFYEESAQLAARMFHRLYQHNNTLGVTPRKISVIIHADGGLNNGNVAMSPRKCELYPTPAQEPGDHWLLHLCIHEFRHITQFDKTRQGLTKAFSYLLGDLSPVIVTGAYLPMWFMEGDAVSFETAVGHMGRGRSPEFLNEMKAQIVDKGIYSLHKAVLGSRVDHVPNRYNMGYFMTANARRHYGPDIWAKAVERTGRRPFGIIPFNRSLTLTMRGTRDGMWESPDFRQLFNNPDSVKASNSHYNSKRTLYLDNFTELREIWKREGERYHHEFDTIPTRNRQYANYFYPMGLEDGSVIAYKSGLQETGSFVRLYQGKEKRITRTAPVEDAKFAFDGRRLLWSEFRPHVRWQQAGRMRLTSYDLQTGRYRSSRGKNNQYAPFRADGNWGYVETDHCNRSYLVLADSTLHHELWRLQAGKNEQFIHPTYHDGQIVTVVQSPSGMHLESINPATSQRRRLTEDIYYELDNPVWMDSTLAYRASYDCNNALYRLDGNGTPQQIQSARYGIRFPYYDNTGQRLYFSFYTADGYKPASISRSGLKAKPVEYREYPLAETMKQQENWQQPELGDSTFASRKYNKLTHLINFHSWAPINIELEPVDLDFGATVYSQNKLSTLSFAAGYIDHSDYDHGCWILDATYSGLWPIFNLSYKNGRKNFQNLVAGYHKKENRIDTLAVINRSRLRSVKVTMQLPFNLSTRNCFRSINPYVSYQVEGLYKIEPKNMSRVHYKNDTLFIHPNTDRRDYDIRQPRRNYRLMEYGLIFSNQTRKTEQEINPRWGQYFRFSYAHTVGGRLDLGSQWWTIARLYVPGFFRNHSFSFYGAYQQMSDENRNFSRQIMNPRGIKLYGYKSVTYRCDYSLPLLFPDWHISSLLYFKQVNASLFVDVGSTLIRNTAKNYTSCGLELSTDTHLLRLTYPLHIGIRAGYENQTRKMFAEMLFNIGISI